MGLDRPEPALGFWVVNGLLVDTIGLDSPKPVEMVVSFHQRFDWTLI